MLPVIAVINQSTVLTDLQIMKVIEPMQKQISNDFMSYWSQGAVLVFYPKTSPLVPGWWSIRIVDDPTQAEALGLHELSDTGYPQGFVFAKTDLESGSSWTVTMSHELCEMVADPWIAWSAEGSDSKIYSLEVSDAVEADELGYQIDGVQVSDFVTPKWFQPQSGADRFDFKQHLKHDLELAPGGYISVFGANGWTQITASLHDAENKPALPAPKGSRRNRRTIPRSEWKRNSSAY